MLVAHRNVIMIGRRCSENCRIGSVRLGELPQHDVTTDGTFDGRVT
jgi:hypothetical protein